MPDQVILREMFRFEKQGPNAAVDAGGHVDGTAKATWLKLCDRRAEVKCLGVQEVQSPDSDQVKAHYVYRVRVRWDRETACVQPKMRGVWLSAAGEPKWMNIQGCIDADGDRRMLTVTCSAPIA